MCTRSDYDLANTSAAAPASGAWIDYNRATSGIRSNSACNYGAASDPWTFDGAFTNSTGQEGAMVTQYGRHSYASCSLSKPLACCRAPSRMIFRGFTTAVYTGNLGGFPGANGKCASEFPGSSLCTRSDYDLANTSAAAPLGGAWIDYNRSTDGTRSSSACNYGTSSDPWTFSGTFTNSTGQEGAMVNPFGRHTYAFCSLSKPLACCSRR